MPNLSWDEEEEEEEEDAEEEEPAEESPEKLPKGQAAKKGSAAKVSTPLAGDAVCGEGSPCHREGQGCSLFRWELPRALIPGTGCSAFPPSPSPKPLSVMGVSRDLCPAGRKSHRLHSESPSCLRVPGPAVYIFLSLP